jgi:hypothetical protein
VGATGAGISFSPIFLFLSVIILVFVVLGLILLFATLKKSVNNTTSTIEKNFNKEDIIYINSSANFFGVKSLGFKQIKGNGILILTNEVLFFRRLLPEMEISIPIENIQSIEEVKSFLSKSIGRKLLKVNYKSDRDKIDSVAWYVDDIKNLKEKLDKLINIK